MLKGKIGRSINLVSFTWFCLDPYGLRLEKSTGLKKLTEKIHRTKISTKILLVRTNS